MANATLTAPGYNYRFNVNTEPKAAPPGLAELLCTLLVAAELPEDQNYTISITATAGTPHRGNKRLGNFRPARGGTAVSFFAQPGNNATAREITMTVPLAFIKVPEAITRFEKAAQSFSETSSATDPSPRVDANSPSPLELLRTNIGGVEHRVDKLRADVEKAVKECDDYQLEEVAHGDRLEEIDAAIQRLVDERKELETKVQNAFQRKTKAQEACQALERDLKNREEELEVLRERLQSALKEEMDKFLRQNGSLRAQDLLALGAYLTQQAETLKS